MNQDTKNSLVINGIRYDAVSGLPVRTAPVAQPSVAKPHHAAPARIVSDIARPVPQVHRPAAAAPVSPHHQVTPPHHIHHAQPAHKAPGGLLSDFQGAQSFRRQPEKSHTLYKTAPHHVVSPAHHHHVGGDIVAHKTPPKLERAASIPRHQAINHFAEQARESVKEPAASSQAAPVVPTANIAIQPHTAEGSQAMSERVEKMLAEQPKEEAINGHNHKVARREHKVKQFFAKQPRLISAATGAMAVLLFVGYIVYLNIPNISLRIAANRAGFSATMPAYKPAGYSLTGPVAYTAGEIQLKYDDASTSYTLTQRQSTWDAQALLQNYVEKQSPNYMTYQDEGLTIYIYNGDAAWVNGGVFYSVDGNANLSSDQILNIATSM